MRRLAVLSLMSVLAASGPALAQHGQGATERSAAMNRTWSEEVASVAETAARFESPEREVIALRPAIIDSLGLKSGARVADVGAGTGAYLKPLAEAVGPGGHVFAVDISAPFAAFMRDRVQREGLSNVTVVLSRTDSPTLPPASVEAILVVNTFHHFEAPEAMLAHFRAALKPGGQLAIVDFDLAQGHAGHREVVALDRAGHIALIQSQGFALLEDVRIEGMKENFVLRFVRR